MPVGPYPTFAACVIAQVDRGKSTEEARRICGALERDTGHAVEFQTTRVRRPRVDSLAAAEQWLRQRVPLSDPEMRDLNSRATQQAFWVAQIGDLRVADQILRSLKRAQESGESFASWKARTGDLIRNSWGVGRRDAGGRVFDQGARLRLIFRNAVNTAFNHARFRQLRSANVLSSRPFWEYRAIRPGKNPSAICDEIHGTVLPAIDPFWDRTTPPLHHNCTGRVIALTRNQAAERGIAAESPATLVAEGFGVPPTEQEIARINIDMSDIDPRLRTIFDGKTSNPP